MIFFFILDKADLQYKMSFKICLLFAFKISML